MSGIDIETVYEKGESFSLNKNNKLILEEFIHDCLPDPYESLIFHIDGIIGVIDSLRIMGYGAWYSPYCDRWLL